MRRQIVYLMSGQAHLPYLTCSLYTLRRWWTGDVIVVAWPESIGIVRRIGEDKSLGIQCHVREPRYRKKNAQFLDKIRLMQSLDGLESMYLDADTTIHGEVYPLFTPVREFGFVATQFNDWKSYEGLSANRIKRLRKFPGIDQTMVERCLSENWLSVNGGVFACRSSSPVLPLWEKWTVEAISVFIADEAVLHLMQPRFYPHGQMMVMAGGAYNCSPKEKFQPKDLPDDKVVIRHYHGDSNVRVNKSRKGYDLWWPIYQECLKKNVGGIDEWVGSISNKYMNRLEESKHGQANESGPLVV